MEDQKQLKEISNIKIVFDSFEFSKKYNNKGNYFGFNGEKNRIFIVEDLTKEINNQAALFIQNNADSETFSYNEDYIVELGNINNFIVFESEDNQIFNKYSLDKEGLKQFTIFSKQNKSSYTFFRTDNKIDIKKELKENIDYTKKFYKSNSLSIPLFFETTNNQLNKENSNLNSGDISVNNKFNYQNNNLCKVEISFSFLFNEFTRKYKKSDFNKYKYIINIRINDVTFYNNQSELFNYFFTNNNKKSTFGYSKKREEKRFGYSKNKEQNIDENSIPSFEFIVNDKIHIVNGYNKWVFNTTKPNAVLLSSLFTKSDTNIDYNVNFKDIDNKNKILIYSDNIAFFSKDLNFRKDDNLFTAIEVQSNLTEEMIFKFDNKETIKLLSTLETKEKSICDGGNIFAKKNYNTNKFELVKLYVNSDSIPHFRFSNLGAELTKKIREDSISLNF